jgi:Protein phosphatase inhibitor
MRHGSESIDAGPVNMLLQAPKRRKKSIKWTEDTVDNEDMNKKRSKSAHCCCLLACMLCCSAHMRLSKGPDQRSKFMLCHNASSSVPYGNGVLLELRKRIALS